LFILQQKYKTLEYYEIAPALSTAEIKSMNEEHFLPGTQNLELQATIFLHFFDVSTSVAEAGGRRQK
jgi:hypothetical protein